MGSDPFPFSVTLCLCGDFAFFSTLLGHNRLSACWVFERGSAKLIHLEKHSFSVFMTSVEGFACIEPAPSIANLIFY